MPAVLAFDTAGSACSVAVGRGDRVLGAERQAMRHGHAEALLPMIGRVMQAAGLGPTDIDHVAVSVGPGGFTGIRAGIAAAHGLALGAGATLLGITSFAAVAAAIRVAEARLLVALDSRRADIYVQLFDPSGAPMTEPATVSPERLGAWVGEAPVRVAGDAAESVAAALSTRRNVELVGNSAPDATGVLAAVRRWPERADPVAHPLYLRAPDVSFPTSRPDRPA
jgi:tRNA threonylcarbamoyladenosine biosynthesis protein TsaB